MLLNDIEYNYVYFPLTEHVLIQSITWHSAKGVPSLPARCSCHAKLVLVDPLPQVWELAESN